MHIYGEIKPLEEMLKADLIVYSIDKEDLIRKRYTNFERILKVLQNAGKKSREKLMITFDGYDNDDREIYLIPEVREFVKYFYDKCNYLFYFITHEAHNRGIIFACINDVKSYKENGKSEVTLEIVFNEAIVTKTINAILRYGTSQNDLDETIKLLDSFI